MCIFYGKKYNRSFYEFDSFKIEGKLFGYVSTSVYNRLEIECDIDVTKKNIYMHFKEKVRFRQKKYQN